MHPLHERITTHRDLLPKNLCPSLSMKHMLAHGLDDRVYDDRSHPGDGFYWCRKTCTCVGPDDEIVEPNACVPGRSCHAGPQA